MAKDEVMLGSYPPKATLQTWISHEESVGSGMAVRGTYDVKSRFTDDDNNDHEEFHWNIHIVKGAE